jgi:hypothetical protein
MQKSKGRKTRRSWSSTHARAAESAPGRSIATVRGGSRLGLGGGDVPDFVCAGLAKWFAVRGRLQRRLFVFIESPLAPRSCLSLLGGLRSLRSLLARAMQRIEKPLSVHVSCHACTYENSLRNTHVCLGDALQWTLDEYI